MAYVAGGAGEGLADEDTLDRFEAHFVEGGRGGAGLVEAEVGGFDLRAAGHEDGAFEGVVELADVAGPAMLQKGLDGGGFEAADLLAVTLGVAGEEVRGERGDVFAAFAERREMDFDGVEAEEEVGTEASGFDVGVEIGVGGGEDADIDAAGF